MGSKRKLTYCGAVNRQPVQQDQQDLEGMHGIPLDSINIWIPSDDPMSQCRACGSCRFHSAGSSHLPALL